MSFLRKKPQNEVDLILSSSGARAPCFIGGVRAAEEKGYKIKRIAGTSGGAIIAAGHALGMTVGEMEDMAINTPFANFKDFSYKNFFSKQNPSLYAGKELDRFYQQAFHGARLGDFEVDCKIIVKNIETRKRIVLTRDSHPELPVWQAVRMSSTIPFVFPFITLDGAPVTDGGLEFRTFDVFDDTDTPIVAIRPRADKSFYSLVDEVQANSIFVWKYLKVILDYALTFLENQHVPQDEWHRTIIVSTKHLSAFNFDMSKEDIVALIEYGYNDVMASEILPNLRG